MLPMRKTIILSDFLAFHIISEDRTWQKTNNSGGHSQRRQATAELYALDSSTSTAGCKFDCWRPLSQKSENRC